MAATENKLNFATGEKDVSSAGTAIVLAASGDAGSLFREIVFTAKAGNTATVTLGDSNAVGHGGNGGRHGPALEVVLRGTVGEGDVVEAGLLRCFCDLDSAVEGHSSWIEPEADGVLAACHGRCPFG